MAPYELIQACIESGVESIEWGSDVHVPAGDLDNAKQIGEWTRDFGLSIASYGSYLGFPWAHGPLEKIDNVIETALSLGAPRIRIWAGPHGSDQASEAERHETASTIGAICDRAAASELEVALEFHHGTLADTFTSTLLLLDEVGAPNLSTYWQPRIGASNKEALADLHGLDSEVSTIHVFSWNEKYERFPLKTKEDLWNSVFERAAKSPHVTDALLEFLPGNKASLLDSEITTMKRWREQAAPGGNK